MLKQPARRPLFATFVFFLCLALLFAEPRSLREHWTTLPSTAAASTNTGPGDGRRSPEVTGPPAPRPLWPNGPTWERYRDGKHYLRRPPSEEKEQQADRRGCLPPRARGRRELCGSSEPPDDGLLHVDLLDAIRFHCLLRSGLGPKVQLGRCLLSLPFAETRLHQRPLRHD